MNGGGGIVFATGTPIANSIAEMFIMQRYLQMTALESLKVDHFDSWAATFGEPVTAMELAPDGAGYRLNTRLRSQHTETQFRLRSQIRHFTDEVPRLEKRLEDVRRDLAIRQDTSGDQFTMQLDGQEVRDRGGAGELPRRTSVSPISPRRLARRLNTRNVSGSSFSGGFRNLVTDGLPDPAHELDAALGGPPRLQNQG